MVRIEPGEQDTPTEVMVAIGVSWFPQEQPQSKMRGIINRWVPSWSLLGEALRGIRPPLQGERSAEPMRHAGVSSIHHPTTLLARAGGHAACNMAWRIWQSGDNRRNYNITRKTFSAVS